MSDFFILPEELMMDIWLTMPIKSTVRFRCVSKRWCASLSDPQFIYKNLTTVDENEKDNNDLLLVHDRERQFYAVVSHETLAAPLQVSPLRDVPSEDEWFREVLTYSCDDLVCFHNESGDVIGVWNLTTGETKILPPVSLDAYRFRALGFGFDHKIQDYKVVQIGSYGYGGDRGEFVMAALVYCLRSGGNCWRKLDEPNLPLPKSCSVGVIPWRAYCRSYMDGIFYWCDSNDAIVSFDMSSEVFNTISIPQHPPRPLESIRRIYKLKDGSMLMMYRAQNHREYQLWAWLGVGMSKSLIKLFHIDWRCGDEHPSPVAFWRNELVFAFVGNPRLLIGDPSSKREAAREVQIGEPFRIITCFPWTKGKNSCSFGVSVSRCGYASTPSKLVESIMSE